MKRILLVSLCLLFFGWNLSNAQNLVINPSFETSSSCPIGPGQFNLTTSWTDINSSADSCSSPDLIAGCAPGFGGVNSPNMLIGYQPSRTGNNHAGLILYEAINLFVSCISDDYREYIGGQLSTPLTAGQSYCVSFYINKANDAQWATDKLGMYFSNNPINNAFTCPGGSVFGVTPQLTYSGPAITDTANWVRVEWNYVASGGEQYFAIGNYATTAATDATIVGTCSFAIHPYAYYFIDDVSVVAGACASCPITVSGTTTDASCGTSNGAIDITPANGTAPYSYIWSNGATTEDLNGLAAGVYDVTVTDNAACTATFSTTVTTTSGLAATPNPLDVSCNGAADGCARVNVTGATGPLTYLWSTGATTDSICNLGPGNYDVTVTETTTAGGTDTLYLEDFEGTHNWTLNVSTGTNSAGADTWTVNDDEGGVLPPGCGVATNGDQTLHITCTSGLLCLLGASGALYNAAETTNLRAESVAFSTVGYTGITVEFDYISNGENLDDNASVFYNDGTGWQVLDPSIKSPVCGTGQGQWTAFSATLPASCDNNPTVQVAINWTSDGDNVGVDPSIAVNNVLVTSISTGGSTCSVVQSMTINEPAALTATNVATDASCGANDGAIDLTVGGGTTGYNYLWSNGATIEDLNSLAGGTYEVTVTDASGCTATSSAIINSAGNFTAAIDTVIDVSCNGANDGAINLSVNAGSGSCSSASLVINEILVNVTGGSSAGDGSGCGNPSLGNPLSAEFIELIGPAGANIGCHVLTDGDWTITIPPGTIMPADGIFTIGNNNTPLHIGNGTTFDLDVNNCGCFTDSCQLMIFTNGGEYLAMFDGTGTFIDGVIYGSPSGINTPPNGINVTGGVINTAGLGGCVSSVTIPGAASFTTTTASVPEGNTYSLSPDGTGGTFTSLSATPNACNAAAPPTLTYNWSTGDTTQNITGLGAGVYTVTVDDGSGSCTAVLTATVTEPSAISVTNPTIVDASCTIPGSIDITVSGGTAGYTFNWSDGQTTEDATGLSAGNYDVTVTDANGCTLTDGPFTVNSSGAPIITIDSSANPSCANLSDGFIAASTTGGTAPYTYLWSDGQVTSTAGGLVAGTYSVTVTDDNGCTATVGNITLTNPTTLSVTVDNFDNATCIGNDGFINISVSGGVGPYNYQWSNGSTTQDISGLAGNSSYGATITDANGCTAALLPTTLGADTSLTITIDTIIPNNCGANDGQIQILVSGGSGNYTFSWSNGDTTQNLTGLGISNDPLQNSYTVNVNDAASGCSGSLTATAQGSLLDPLNPFIGAVGVTDSSIYVGETINVDAGTNQAGVTYSWTGPSDVNFDDANIAATLAGSDVAGEYTLTITATDTFNCTVSDTLNLEVLEDNPQIPDAFTPDDDSNDNHIFKVEGMNDVSNILEFRVYNRWGQVVYKNDDGAAQWDGTFKGTAQPRDVYIYVISWQRPQDTEPVVTRGQVTLLR